MIFDFVPIMGYDFKYCMGDTLKIIGQRKEIDELKEQVKYNV